MRKYGESQSVFALSLSKALSLKHIDIYQKCFDKYETVLSFPPSKFKKISLIKKGQTYEGKEELLKKAEEIKADCKKLGINWLTIIDKSYPKALKEIYQPPLVLYYKGELPPFYLDKPDTYCLSIVGTRKSDAFANRMTYQIAKQFTSLGGQIISGLAMGIDTCAHRGACEVGATTAVLGCGVDVYYPYGNKFLYKKILDQGGCILSEFIPGTLPLKMNFPLRNRIISGISEGVLVMQAPLKSGSLITIDYGLNQGKTIFAYDFNNPNLEQVSEINLGNYKVIQDGGIPIKSLDDILEHQFNFLKKTQDKNSTVNISQDTTLEKRLLEEISHAPRSISSLSKGLEIEIPNLAKIIMKGILSGQIEELPGKRYFKGIN